jgi:hypothetical protein
VRISRQSERGIRRRSQGTAAIGGSVGDEQSGLLRSLDGACLEHRARVLRVDEAGIRGVVVSLTLTSYGCAACGTFKQRATVAVCRDCLSRATTPWCAVCLDDDDICAWGDGGSCSLQCKCHPTFLEANRLLSLCLADSDKPVSMEAE